MRVLIFLMFLIGAALISKNACAADLPLPAKPAVQRATPLSQDERHRLFEEYLQFLKEKAQPSR